MQCFSTTLGCHYKSKCRALAWSFHVFALLGQQWLSGHSKIMKTRFSNICNVHRSRHRPVFGDAYVCICVRCISVHVCLCACMSVCMHDSVCMHVCECKRQQASLLLNTEKRLFPSSKSFHTIPTPWVIFLSNVHHTVISNMSKTRQSATRHLPNAKKRLTTLCRAIITHYPGQNSSQCHLDSVPNQLGLEQIIQDGKQHKVTACADQAYHQNDSTLISKHLVNDH